MGQTTTGSGPAAPDAAALGEAIAEILATSVNEHMQWNTGFFQWSQAQLTNFQPVPPQAYADFANRQNWMIGFIQRFTKTAEILSKAGDSTLSSAIATYLDGFRRLMKDFDAMQGHIASDYAATAAKLQGIQSKMHADTLAAGAARMDIQNKTFAETFQRQSETMANQRGSFERMNRGFTDSIDS